MSIQPFGSHMLKEYRKFAAETITSDVKLTIRRYFKRVSRLKHLAVPACDKSPDSAGTALTVAISSIA